MAFITKKLAVGETIGSYLAELMREGGFTVEAVAQQLHLQQRHVRALLRNDFTQLPGAYYTKHLVRRLTDMVGGNVEYAEKLFDRSMSGEVSPDDAPEKIFEYRRVRRASLIVIARVVTGLALGGVLAVLFVSFAANIRHALTPPSVDLLNPASDLVTNERQLIVEGKTEPEVTLRVNGEQIVTDSAGVFSTPLYLDDGLNIIEVRAAKRYSKDQIIYRRVLVEQKGEAVSQR